MSVPRGQHAHPWVQPIIVAKGGAHEETVLLGAQASATLYLRPRTGASAISHEFAWDEWLSGPFTKTVRRASYTDLQRVIAWAGDNSVPCEGFEAGDSAAFALPPMRYADLPKAVSRLQVAGTDLPRSSRRTSWSGPHDEDLPWVSLHVDETLTTGKATAQAAHALWAWLLDQPTSRLAAWRDAGYPCDLHLLDEHSLYEMSGPPGLYPIFDAGLTEVAPNTLTAVAENWSTRS